MRICLRIHEGSTEYDYECPGPSLAVGRNPAGDLVLEKDTSESVVSWDHARIHLSPDGATLSDLNSTNGTYRNDQPVLRPVRLWPGDVIRLGLTGPTFRILNLDLKTAPPPQSVPLKQANAGSDPPAKTKPKIPPPRPMSETRGIALQAMKELQSHRTVHTRQKKALLAVSGAGLLVALLLALVLWSHRRGIAELGDAMRDKAQETADHFAQVQRDLEDQRQLQARNLAKVDEVAQHLIDQEAALKGGLDRVRRDLGATIGELNQRLAKSAVPADRPPEPVPDHRVSAPNTPPAPRIEPGMKVGVIVKNKDVYTGVLIGIVGETIRVQTIPDATARPHEWRLRDVQAFQTPDGIFALNETTNEFELALTFYRFDKSLREFLRLESASDLL